MGRRKPKPEPGKAVAAWGWYGILAVSSRVVGGSVEGLMAWVPPTRAFWCAWWSEDPRRNQDAEPDDFGFVEGAKCVDQAVGAAYDSLRKGRGQRIFDVCVGEAITARAYKAGAPTRRSRSADFDALAGQGLDALGLGPDATVAQVKAAYRREVKKAHPDQGGTAEGFRDLRAAYEAALAEAQRREQAKARADIAAGKAPPRKARKPRRKAAAEQAAM